MKSIKSFLPVFPGYYGTIFEPDETDMIEDDKTYEDYTWDYKDYQQRTAAKFCQIIESELSPIVQIEIAFEAVCSPREYNFANDSINCTYKINAEALKIIHKYLLDNKDAFEEYLTRYTSCSGFISSYSNSSNTWISDYWKEIETNAHILGSILDFLCENEDINTDTLYDNLDGENYVGCTLKEEDLTDK